MEYIILAIVIGGLGYLYFFLTIRWGNLTQARKQEFRSELERASELDPEHAIIVVDRVLEQILSTLWGKRSLGENLQKHYQNHPDSNELWKYHKIRNKLVHEGGVRVGRRDIEGFRNLIQRVFL